MDKRKKLYKSILESFDFYINRCKYCSKKKENKTSEFTKQNKEKKNNQKNSSNNKKSFSNSKFKYYDKKKNILFKNVHNLLMINVICFILLNINEILCESYIIVKINKSGYYNILFNGDIQN